MGTQTSAQRQVQTPLRMGPGPKAETPDAGPQKYLLGAGVGVGVGGLSTAWGPPQAFPDGRLASIKPCSQKLGWASQGPRPPRVGWALAARFLGLGGGFCGAWGVRRRPFPTPLSCVSLSKYCSSSGLRLPSCPLEKWAGYSEGLISRLWPRGLGGVLVRASSSATPQPGFCPFLVNTWCLVPKPLKSGSC